jgi:hypothetical protein
LSYDRVSKEGEDYDRIWAVSKDKICGSHDSDLGNDIVIEIYNLMIDMFTNNFLYLIIG